MTVQKLSYPSKENAVQEKINEIIDNLGGGSADIDNLSITKNSSDELQAVGVINKNTASGATNPKYDWVGTLQEYETQQVETLHPDWICFITDDVQGGSSVYTKSQVNNLLSVKANSADVYTKTETDTALSSAISTMLEGLYPVGSIYIGTTSTCPIASLISGSTWTIVSSDRVLQGSSGSHTAGSIIEAGLPNITGTLAASWGSNASDKGAFHNEGNDPNTNFGGNSSWNNSTWASFDASRSNSIYGKSSTVQPPAYVVNVWRRTA